MAKKTTQQDMDEQAEIDAILDGVPELLPPERFRQRQRSNLQKLAIRFRGVAVDDETAIDTEDPAVAETVLDLLADLDDFFESIAVDKDAYIEWATGLGSSEEIYGALLARYAVALGE